MKWKRLRKFVLLFMLSFILLLVGSYLKDASTIYEAHLSNKPDGFELNLLKKRQRNLTRSQKKTVEIWGKASIGSYLWGHLFNGSIEVDNTLPGALQGHKTLESIDFIYREGPGVNRGTVSKNVKYLILVGNGRSHDKVNFTEDWLKFINTFNSRPRTVLIMLGNEMCKNKWLSHHIAPAGPLNAVLLTYDSIAVDDKFYYQWPLGVATYRNFPRLETSQISPELPRKYICNFKATIYSNSSRSYLIRVIEADPLVKENCIVSKRERWIPSETSDSMNDYVWSLLQSDLTLCPSGKNAETYRVYEALSAGSVPVIENSPGVGSCDNVSWRLLKKYGAPAIWVKNWKELPVIIKKEMRYSVSYKIHRRLRVLKWYTWFKRHMQQRLLNIIKSNIF